MKLINQNKCIFCGESEWLPLPTPAENQSITTACVMVKQSLGKAQCKNCGLVQRVDEKCLGETDYYETNYQGYYSRPATMEYHKKRYERMINWISSAITPLNPEKILDVGCGQGGAMLATQDVYPNALIEGLEPSIQNSKQAEEFGFKTICSRMGESIVLDKKYNLAISIYVAQHVLDPIDFFKGVKNNLEENGVCAVVVPNGNIPNIELLWSDQNFAFTADQVVSLAEKAGLQLISLFESPEGISPSWLVILGNNLTQKLDNQGIEIPITDKNKLYKQKCDYLNSFIVLDKYLCEKSRKKDRVINFGASFWTSILATYCPNYWKLVDFCTVNGDQGEIMGKEVLPFEEIIPKEKDAIVVALAKDAQKTVAQRLLKENNIEAITWFDIVEC